jgi:hypothetical protein
MSKVSAKEATELALSFPNPIGTKEQEHTQT